MPNVNYCKKKFKVVPVPLKIQHLNWIWLVKVCHITEHADRAIFEAIHESTGVILHRYCTTSAVGVCVQAQPARHGVNPFTWKPHPPALLIKPTIPCWMIGTGRPQPTTPSLQSRSHNPPLAAHKTPPTSSVTQSPEGRHLFILYWQSCMAECVRVDD